MDKNQFILTIKDHVAKSRSASTHPAKLLVLSSLLKALFGVELQELIPGIESKLGSKLWGIRGSADLIFSNVVFEIKVNLEAEIESAEKQLMKYFQVLVEREPGKKHVGIASDVVEFVAYIPVIRKGEVVGLSKVGSINIAEAASPESILWLDSFVFSKPKIQPSAMDLRWRFGPDSPTYWVSIDRLTSLWKKVGNEKDVALKLELWAKNMEIVYGDKPEFSSFIDHTYLVTLVKLIVYLRLSGDNTLRENRFRRVLSGKYFSSYGIANLIEEDFFAWLLHPKIVHEALQLVGEIAKELLRYDLSQIDEDFFKGIYQEIVKLSERHRIGEYYTPEWLVEQTLRESLSLHAKKHEKTPRLLDPACGSGTFLCNAIHILKKRLLDEKKRPGVVLDILLDDVVGVDVNPLAVVIARANYVVALGDLLQLGKRVLIPVYVADSVNVPRVTHTLTEKGKTSVYEFRVEEERKKGKPRFHTIQIPKRAASQKLVLSEVVDAFKAAIDVYRTRKNRNEAIRLFRRSCPNQLSEDDLSVLDITLKVILTLVDKGLNAIWAFMLSNIYAPVMLKESKFDIVVGNPPWILMRYVENKNYQEFLKQQVFLYDLLNSDQVHQFSNMEMATAFFCRSCDLYLKKNGIMAFVMPRSVLTGAMHHVNFKRFKNPKSKLIRILDLENVEPLFNVPSCVLIAYKGKSTKYPVPAKKFSGSLEEKNVKLRQAVKQLQIGKYKYTPPKVPTEYSVYHKKIRKGIDITPRCLWFVEFDPHKILGVDVNKPVVKSASDVLKLAKPRWKGKKLRGLVEADFIYASLLAGNLVSFGYTRMRPVALPIETRPNRYRLLDAPELRRRGFKCMADWIESAQRIWEETATERSITNFPRVVSWLNYMNKLDAQNPRKRFIVLYNASGTNIAACVVDKHALPDFALLRAEISPKGFIAEQSTFFYESNDEMEVGYLCSVLNSDVINESIKPLQPMGLFGERAVTRRPFMFPIPQFKKHKRVHAKLAEQSEKCHAKLARASGEFKGRSVAGFRRQAREAVAEEIEKINRLVTKLLKI